MTTIEKKLDQTPDITGDATERDARRVFEKQQKNRWATAQTTAKERIEQLKRLKDAILDRREELQQAIHQDYKKNPGEVDLTEIYPAVAEIRHIIRHLENWMRPTPVKTPFTLLGTRSEVRLEAKGVVLILSPWNYPFGLLINPLAAAIAAGNCAMLKPSSKTPNTARFLKSFISSLFNEGHVALFEGGSSVSDILLDLPFDHIFFTGSTRIGKKVMASASRHLTPVTLELGGKSPVIVDETADIPKAAERIVWAKFINAGQTCVAPDYLLIHESRQEEFVREAKRVIGERYGRTEDARRTSADLCRLVSAGNLKSLKEILDQTVQQGARVEIGGAMEAEERYLAPTLLTGVSEQSPIMREEIFGPVLPILSYRTLNDVFRIIRSKDKPLALYIFSHNDQTIEKILANTTAGGTCVNSLIVHLANTNLPFGGVGASGMGNYHGYYGFKTFSHERAVLRQGWPDSL
ncbi:MAG: aldehyde dehydrogenase family protein, partial [Elusimicrobiota bacterium]